MPFDFLPYKLGFGVTLTDVCPCALGFGVNLYHFCMCTLGSVTFLDDLFHIECAGLWSKHVYKAICNVNC